MLAGHCYARRMDDVGFDLVHAQPTRQPEAIATGLIGDRNPRDRVAALHSLVAPAVQQSKQFLLIRSEFLQWLTLDAGNGPTHQPARFAQLQTDDILPRNS